MHSFSAANRNILFSFMRENNFPVYHLSNMFFRDIEYAIRDFVREKDSTDIGGREAGRLASAFVADLEKLEILLPHGKNTWILHDEEYSLKKATTEEGAVAEEAEQNENVE